MQDAEFLGNKLFLEEVQRQFEHWRKDRKFRDELIPEQIWESAVSLSQNYLISKISQALRLSHLRLKSHNSKKNKKGILKADKNSPPCPSFAELDLNQTISTPQCVVEMEKSNGAKMKNQLKRRKFESVGVTKNILGLGVKIQIAPHMKILLAIEAVDFRKGIDGLCRVCRVILKSDPFSGYLFLFRNKRCTSIKILMYDGQGFWLCRRRLSQGRFYWWPNIKGGRLTHLAVHELQMLIRNGDPKSGKVAPLWREIHI
jgi:hypothetical protein